MSIMGKIVNFILKITSFLPRRNIIIFESSPNFSDNTYWFFKYRHFKKIQVGVDGKNF